MSETSQNIETVDDVYVEDLEAKADKVARLNEIAAITQAEKNEIIQRLIIQILALVIFAWIAIVLFKDIFKK